MDLREFNRKLNISLTDLCFSYALHASLQRNIASFHYREHPYFLREIDDRRAPEFTERKKDTMFAALVRFIQEWKRYNRSLNELSRLGDRELADIGISRSDIPRVAWNASQRG